MSALVEAFAAAEAIGIKQHRIRVGDLHFNVSRFATRPFSSTSWLAGVLAGLAARDGAPWGRV